MKKAKKKSKKKEKLSKWSLKKPMYIDKTDKRYEKYLKQLKDTGFSDTETWNLLGVIAEFILPRLKRFREIANGHPGVLTEAKWNKILDKMIFSFEWTLVDSDDFTHEHSTDKQLERGWKRYEEGMELFREYFMALWW